MRLTQVQVEKIRIGNKQGKKKKMSLIKPGHGERLKSERKRMALSQEALGNLCGVQRLAQLNYEKEESTLTLEYMKKAEKAGVDILFVLSGVRTSKIDVESALNCLKSHGYKITLETTSKVK